MGFTLQEKSSMARRHATLDPILQKGKKGEFGGWQVRAPCLAHFRLMITEGGMRFAFPPYGLTGYCSLKGNRYGI
jgi:hypothetical protein